jgi:serine/threonine-protein phosphatase 2B catalytic subunit
METLRDPLGDRKVKDLPGPPILPLSDELMWGPGNIPDWELIVDHMKAEGKISKENMVKLIGLALDIIKKEPCLVHMKEPICLVGDIHGQFYDLVHLIEKAGKPSKINYLFMGDYVDRGVFSIEVIIMLFSLKINYPESLLLLRGNHECRNMTQHFTFREEALTKFDEEVYNMIMEVFDALPLAAVVNKKYFAVHGGISPDLKKIEMINNIDRFKEPPTEGMFCDLLWSDPLDDAAALEYEYKENEDRECSYLFGRKPVKKLLEKNDLMSVVRAHQVQVEGYKMHRWDGDASFPYVITIFSAPNY